MQNRALLSNTTEQSSIILQRIELLLDTKGVLDVTLPFLQLRELQEE